MAQAIRTKRASNGGLALLIVASRTLSDVPKTKVFGTIIRTVFEFNPRFPCLHPRVLCVVTME